MTSPPAQHALLSSVQLYARIAELTAARTPLVVVTVAGVSGSTPSQLGGKLLVTTEAQWGTIGGGKVELAAIALARDILLSDGPLELVERNLVKDVGMTCGGTVKLLFEPVRPASRLVVFGAGHIAAPLCAAAAAAGFASTVIDEREDWLTSERFPAAVERILAAGAAAVARARLDADSYVVVVTPGHAFDENLLRVLLKNDPRPRYIGVIGSRRKAIVLKNGLRDAGVAPERVASVRIPVGLNIGAETPDEIAISIVAELIAVKRGVEKVEPWLAP